MFWDDDELKREDERNRERDRSRKKNRSGKNLKKKSAHHRHAKKQSRAGRVIMWGMIVICAGVFCFSAYQLISILMVYHHNDVISAEIQELFYETVDSNAMDFEDSDDDSTSELLSLSPSDVLAPLKEINQEVVGWIYIEDTTIDYPILQSSDNDYYLTYNIYNEYTSAGSIFMDYRNEIGNPLQNYILYGHRMKNDSMFGNLSLFLDEEFFEEHQTFSLILEDGFYTCEIFSVYQTTTYGFSYTYALFSSSDDYLTFVSQLQAQSYYETDVEITAEDQIITLSTCDYELDADEGRLVVHAKLVEQTASDVTEESEGYGETTESGSEDDAA